MAFPCLERIIIGNIHNYLMSKRSREDNVDIVAKYYPLEYGHIVLQQERGDTLLHFPAYGYDVFKVLLENNVDPHVPDQEGKTPLHHATNAIGEKINIIELLLQYGADPYFKDSAQHTAGDLIAKSWSFNATFNLPDNLGIQETLSFWQTHYPRTITSSNLELLNGPEIAWIKSWVKWQRINHFVSTYPIQLLALFGLTIFGLIKLKKHFRDIKKWISSKK